MPQTLSDIKALLAAYGLRPKYRLGQNFLHDHNQMGRILAAADIGPGDLVLEVGPGTGALSEELLAAGARLVAVEIDRDLEPILRERFEPFPGRATLVLADILASKRQLSPEVLEYLAGQPFKLVANLPYNVASPLLINLAADHPGMTHAVVMVQREVADRLAARPGGKEYGPLTVIIQAMCHARIASTLSPGCFWPQPKVSSAVVALHRRQQPLTDDPHRLLALLHRLFTRRRKQLGSILGRQTPLPEGITPDQRPETLSVEQLCRLADWLAAAE